MPTARWPEGADFALEVPTKQRFSQSLVAASWSVSVALLVLPPEPKRVLGARALDDRTYLTGAIDDTQVYPGPPRVVLVSARIAQ
jgi:hypothetical protein